MPHPMITGRFYYDTNKSLKSRIEYAARSYYDVVGVYPNRAHVNPIFCNQPAIVKVDDHNIKVVGDNTIDKNITWMGEGVNN